jgi:DNA-directed RNA polymerase subunit RPC12/RpoP
VSRRQTLPPEDIGNAAAVNMAGQQLGHWTIISKTWSRRSRAQWTCRCLSCGAEATISGTHLRSMPRRGLIACQRCGAGKDSPNPANKT